MITITQKALEDLAKIAYEAYGRRTDFKNYQGLPMPKWDNLTPTIRDAWNEAAAAVINANPAQQIQIRGSNNRQNIT